MTKLLRNYVNGKWMDTGRSYANVNPTLTPRRWSFRTAS
jgi:hypothetical protein